MTVVASLTASTVRVNACTSSAMFLPYSTGALASLSVDSRAFQARFPESVENSLWEMDQIVRVTIYIAGSTNNRAPWSELPERDFINPRDDKYEKRDVAAIAWLDKTFALAENNDSCHTILSQKVCERERNNSFIVSRC